VKGVVRAHRFYW